MHSNLISSERYSINRYQFKDIAAPISVIDDWLQLSLHAGSVPPINEQNAVLKALLACADEGKRIGTVAHWGILRKLPGLKVRFKIVSDEQLDVFLHFLIHTLTKPQWPWLTQISFDSLFNQRELLGAAYETTYGHLIDHVTTALACSPLLAQGAQGTTALPGWVACTAQIALWLTQDEWQAWELLGRFEQFRADDLFVEPACVLYDASPLLSAIEQLSPPDKPLDLTSAAMLLNYVYNIWAVNGPAQAHLVAQSRERLTPSIVMNLRDAPK
jgi:hypothetical protein